MISLNAKIRKETGRKTFKLRNLGTIPAVIYGHGIKNIMLEIDAKEFAKVFKDAGESSLIELHVEGLTGESGKRPVLVHDMQIDPVSGDVMHIDFFQASLKEEVEVKVQLVFEGSSLAVKDLGGTLVKNMSELEIKSLPQNLPHEIKVSIENLKTFSDRILVRDIILPAGVKTTAKQEEIIASVSAPENVEEDLSQAIEEKVEDVEKIEKEKKEEVIEDVEK